MISKLYSKLGSYYNSSGSEKPSTTKNIIYNVSPFFKIEKVDPYVIDDKLSYIEIDPVIVVNKIFTD